MIAVRSSASLKKGTTVACGCSICSSIAALSGCADVCMLCRPRTCSQLQVGPPQLPVSCELAHHRGNSMFPTTVLAAGMCMLSA